MRADQAKTIPIDQYLDHLGQKPAKVRMGGKELWYHSPLRDGDSTPSFKVNTIINKWYDHGLARGGNTLDLAIEMCRGSVRDALHALDRTGLYSAYGYAPRGNGFSHVADTIAQRRLALEKENEGSSAFRVVREGPIEHPALVQYLEKRCIDLGIARRYLKEIRFEPAQGGKWYFALGWPNGTGFEARNALFKGFVGTGKDVTYLKTENTADCFIFEGFMDFLSYLSEHQITKPRFSTIVLNSATMKARALSCIAEGGYRRVHLFMDHDATGDECLGFFQGTLESLELVDHRSEYEGFKDFNEKAVADRRT